MSYRITRNPFRRADDLLWISGSDGDIASLLRSATLAANTALTSVLVGTAVTDAIAANSLILSNVTASGDFLFAANRGGNSEGFFWYDSSAGDLRLRTATTGSLLLNNGATELGRLTSGGILFLGDTSNAGMTVGLTLNQGANDNEIFALKSSDVAHGYTTRTETDTFHFMQKASVSAGGLSLEAFSSATLALQLVAGGVTDNTAKLTTATAYAVIYASKRSGTDLGAPGLDANLAAIQANGTTRFIFDAEGSGHGDVEWVAFDTHNDLALLDALQREWTGRLTPARYGDNPIYYNRGYLESIGIVGKNSWHLEDRDGRLQKRSMVNFTKLAMLHHGALLQAGDRLAILENQYIALHNQVARLNRIIEDGGTNA